MRWGREELLNKNSPQSPRGRENGFPPTCSLSVMLWIINNIHAAMTEGAGSTAVPGE